ncbi:MAG: rod shape-determining protein MreC [Candidatus Pacebacteria bacterium]|nr:rod shape-determining protein MreC [Candidatus Paceibacterota bacterium]
MQKKVIDFKTLFFLFIILFIMIFLDRQGYMQSAKGALFSFFSPIQSRLYSSSSGVVNFFKTLEDIGDFKEENEKLQAENIRLTFELSKLQEVDRENELLNKQLKFKEDLCGEDDCLTFKEGSVISRSPDSYEKSVVINLGSADGVEKNSAVTIAGGVMIGKVSEVFEDYSKVILLTSPQSSVNCLSQTTRANGLVKGQYGTGVELEMIDQSEELIKGDLIITSGFEEGIPGGLILGRIAEIEESPNVVFKSAEIELFSDFSRLEEIFLVTKNE